MNKPQFILTTEEAHFKMEVRKFIQRHLPYEVRSELERGAYFADVRRVVEWQRILYAKGWGAPRWPVEYGGTDWTPIQQFIFKTELGMAPAPEPFGFNINLVGPVLIRFGSDWQKDHFLPRLASMDYVFCQGFSEPNAGSDLAAVATRAVRDGDDFVVNGQKTWTTIAHEADWMFALVRTDPTAGKKQEGISFLLIDMTTSGITVRPIRTIDSIHHVNEVFFTDVRVPARNMVGQENRGWECAKYLLLNERTGIGRVGRSRDRLRVARQVAATTLFNGSPRIEDEKVRTRLMLLEIELRALEATEIRAIRMEGDEAGVSKFASIIKLKGAAIHQAAAELIADILGEAALIQSMDRPVSPQEELGWALPLSRSYLHSRAVSIFGGTDEIQKTLIAKAFDL
jgi:alkylation response protein AidB-like acyl-CoA dehydrogenase